MEKQLGIPSFKDTKKQQETEAAQAKQSTAFNLKGTSGKIPNIPLFTNATSQKQAPLQ